MEEIIKPLISDIECIKLSLKGIAENGIPIVDTFAPISTFVNILTTIFATTFGGIITLRLFKSQEKIRIREELKLDFYKQYEKLYKTVLEGFSKYKLEIEKVSKYISMDSDGKLRNLVDAISTSKDVKENYKIIRDGKNIIENIKNDLQRLEEFMESKKTITGYKDDKYIKIKAEILKYDNYFKCLNSIHEIICCDEKKNELQTEYCTNIIIEDISQETINDLVGTYKRVFRKLYNKKEEFELLLSAIKNINEKIESEFIGKYFI